MTAALSPLLNPLATVQQLESNTLSLAGVSKELEDSIRFEVSRLLQASGILLRMPQDLIAQAIVLLCRYWTGVGGASMLSDDPRIVAAASLYLAAKPSAHTLAPRLLLMTFEYLTVVGPSYDAALKATAPTWSFTDGKYEQQRTQLYAVEARMLAVLGYNTHVALPYTVCINYMQALDIFKTGQGSAVAKRAFEHLNSALFSAQLLYLTHQPSTLAVAAIYLAAREIGEMLPETEWWEVFDVDREDLGFVVVSLLSTTEFVRHEMETTKQRSLYTIESVREHMQGQVQS